MFKRAKKLSPTPTAPNIDEILSDLETFHVEKPVRTRVLNSTSSSNSGNSANLSQFNNELTTLQEWWKIFETFLSDVDDLKQMKTDINGFKIKLESSQLEIDTVAKNIITEINENLEKTRIEVQNEEDDETSNESH